MPKVKTTYADKIQFIVKEFPDEFMQSIDNDLYCNLCNCAVSCSKRFLVDSHRNTSKHQKALGSRSEELIPQTSQTFLRSSDTDFVEKVAKAFLSIDIPLYKLNNTHIKKFFRGISHRLPFETTYRRTTLQLSKDELKRIRNAVRDKQIFLIVDKSTVSGTQYLNILVGNIETPHVSYLYDCQPLKCDPNSNIIAQAVDDAVRNLGINRSFFFLLLSDAAKYMIAVGITLKSLYPKLFHVTCVAHLLHDCAMKIKSRFKDVDQLIAKIKAVTINNKTRQAKVSAIATHLSLFLQDGETG